jgi:hypothetical protein
MAVEAQTVAHPDRHVRWFMVPAVGALLAAAAALWRHRIQPSSLTPVSQEWLRTHGVQAGRRGEL